jgi:hypothetical protein
MNLSFDPNGDVQTEPSFEDFSNTLLNHYTSMRREVVAQKSVIEFVTDLVARYKFGISKRLPLYLIGCLDNVKRWSYDKTDKERFESNIAKVEKEASEFVI